MGGDFSGRMGERGARSWEEEKGDRKRKSNDKVENAEGRWLLKLGGENGRKQTRGWKTGID